MANAAAVCTSFKVELLLGQHQFGTATLVSRTSLTAPTTDIFKAALYLLAGSIGAGTTAYTSSNEVSGTGYTAGGGTAGTFTWVAPATAAGTAYTTPSATITWPTVTLGAFDCVLLYNSTQSNRAVASYAVGTIGTGQSVTAGNFSLTMPTNDQTTGLLRIA